ncbi:MAG: Lcl C-terminal domain-containing protein [Planctomycetota bacterium]|jgi:hypothetical protein
MRKHLKIETIIFLCVFFLIPFKQSTAEERPSFIELRSSYLKLPVSQVQSMSNITIRKKKKWGFYGHSTIKHEYEVKAIGGDKVVIDLATGLMWHQSGSFGYMRRDEIKKWVRSLNRRKYAGYCDWRLPTVEEAVSLLESCEKNGSLYIDNVFDKKQRWIWTGDSHSLGGVWRIYFDDGYVDWGDVSYLYVRPVRTI